MPAPSAAKAPPPPSPKTGPQPVYTTGSPAASATGKPRGGRPPAKTGPYLIPHRTALLFRIRVPADVQICLGRTEYRRSLGPCYASEAKLQALRLATAAHEVFAFVREALTLRETESKNIPPAVSTDVEGKTLESLTDDEIRAIAEDWLLAALKGSNALRLETAKQRLTLMANEEDAEQTEQAEIRIRQGIKGLHQKALKRNDMTRMRPEADRVRAFPFALQAADAAWGTPAFVAFQDRYAETSEFVTVVWRFSQRR